MATNDELMVTSVHPNVAKIVHKSLEFQLVRVIRKKITLSPSMPIRQIMQMINELLCGPFDQLS